MKISLENRSVFWDFGSVFGDIGSLFTIFSILKKMTRVSKIGVFSTALCPGNVILDSRVNLLKQFRYGISR